MIRQKRSKATRVRTEGLVVTRTFLSRISLDLSVHSQNDAIVVNPDEDPTSLGIRERDRRIQNLALLCIAWLNVGLELHRFALALPQRLLERGVDRASEDPPAALTPEAPFMVVVVQRV